MNTLKKTVLTTLVATTFASGAFATDNEQSNKVDASDMTRAYSTFNISASNGGDVKASGSVSYNYDNGMASMFSLEGTINKDGDYSDSRAQYFHVFNTQNAVSPRVAVSLDVIDNDTATTAALGAISIFRTPIDSLTFYGRVGALTGTYSDASVKAFGASDDSLTGGMAAAYAVWKTGQDGTYLALYPEFTYLSGDIDTTTVKTTLMASTPLSADKTRWAQVKFENTSGSMESSSRNVDINENKVWFNYKVFL